MKPVLKAMVYKERFLLRRNGIHGFSISTKEKSQFLAKDSITTNYAL